MDCTTSLVLACVPISTIYEIGTHVVVYLGVAIAFWAAQVGSRDG